MSVNPGDLLDVLRRYSRPVRTLVLCMILPLLLLAGYETYHWPASWPTPAMWLNLLIAGGVVLAIYGLVLIDPDQKASLDKLPEVKPIMEDSLKYFKLERQLSAGRKNLILKVREQIKAKVNPLLLSDEDLGKCVSGPWEFDRIVHHLWARYKTKFSFSERMGHVKDEKLILDTTSWEGSLAPLHHAIEAVFDSNEDTQPPSLSEPEFQLINEILSKLNGWKTRLRRRLHLDIRGDGIIKNCQAILRGRDKATRQK